MEKTKKLPTFLKHPSNNFIVTNSSPNFAISLDSVRNVLEFLFSDQKVSAMAIHFVGKRKIAKLHQQFFSDPTPTDCITFPYDEDSFLGEVYICPEVGAEYIQNHRGALVDEITLYVVHGYLHLMGYDDQTPAQKKEMRRLEKKWMDLLAKNGSRVKIIRK